ncbi:MAG TPA: leucine-rich repeat protein [Clostridiales bacterium]|nr:leucine-rich repeat protein [Clostridiales bacterium]
MSAKKVFGTAIFVITVMLLLSLGVFFNPSDPIGAFEHQFTVYDADINLEEEEAVFTVSRNFSNTAASINYRTVSLTAFEGTHFTPQYGLLEFEEGEYEKEIIVPITSANEEYTTYEATKYSNIDREFYLEIYNPSYGGIDKDKGTATLSKDLGYQVGEEAFDFSQTFTVNLWLESGTGGFCSDVTMPLDGYCYLVSDGYYINLTIEYTAECETLSQFLIALMPHDTTDIPQYNESFVITSLNDAHYAALFNTDNTQISEFEVPFVSPAISIYYSLFGEDMLEDELGLRSDKSAGYDLYFENINSDFDSLISINGIQVDIKVQDISAPAFLGTSGFYGTYKQGDELFISLVFDEVISQESDLSDSYFSTTSGDFYYHSGAGSNILVYRGVLGEVEEEIEFLSFNNGSIEDFSGNQTAFEEPFSVSIEVEKSYDYTAEHYKVNSTGGFDLAQTEVFQGKEGEVVYAQEKDFSGYTVIEHPDSVQSGAVLSDGSLTLKLFYKLNQVYLGGGSDANDGSTPSTAVATFAAAKNMILQDGFIIIADTVIISDEQIWDDSNVLRGFEGVLINIGEGGKLTLTNVIIDGKKDEFGSGLGSMIVVQEGGELVISGASELKNNNSTGLSEGGAINNSGTLVIQGGSITQNNSNFGGGIFNNSSGEILLTGGIIAENTASNGGGIYNSEGKVEIENVDIYSNTATSTNGGGGGIYTTAGELILNGDEVKIYQNKAVAGSSKGGGIFAAGWSAQKGSLRIHNALIFENESVYGGGIYITEDSYLNIANGQISHNIAAYGGGVYSESVPEEEYSFVGGLIQDNYAGTEGGGLYVNGGEFVMNGGEIRYNQSEANGGGVFVSLSALFTLEDGLIVENEAIGSGSIGGGIKNYGTIDIQGGTVQGNSSYQTIGFIGGGIANSGVFYLDGGAEISDVIHLTNDFPIKLTGLPENEKVFEIFYGYDPIEEFFDSVCVEGYLVNAEEAKQNFDVLNIEVLLSASDNNLILKQAIRISFNRNDSFDGTGTMSPQYGVEGETIILSYNRYARFNHKFLGWSTQKDDVYPEYSDQSEFIVPDQNVVLYAIWLRIIPKWQEYVASSFDGGDGSPQDPYQIKNAAQLAYLAQLVNQGNIAYSQKHYILTDDIDLSAADIEGEDYIIWVPIGIGEEIFRGVFDGNGYQISGLFVDIGQTDYDNFGLFGNVSNGATIKNVGLKDIVYTGTSQNGVTIGGLVYNANNANFLNVYVEDISLDLEADSVVLGPILVFGTNITLENFYVLNVDANISGSMTTHYIGDLTGSNHVAVGYYYSNDDQLVVYENIDNIEETTPSYEEMYDTAVAYNSLALKEGRDLRFYYWIDSDDYFPRLQKLELLEEVYLTKGEGRSLGSDTVFSFDEAIIALKKGGTIVLTNSGGDFEIEDSEIWTLPQAVFGEAFVLTQINIFVTSSGTLTLRDISIQPELTQGIINRGTLLIEEGTSIIAMIVNENVTKLFDNLDNQIDVYGIVCEDGGSIEVHEPLFDSILLDTSFLASGYPLITGVGLDISGYIYNFTLDDRVLLFEENWLVVYTVENEVYLDIYSPTDGSGLESNPVNNIQKALDVVNPVGGIIYIINTYDLDEDVTWDFSGYDIILCPYIYSNNLFKVNENTTLTLINANIKAVFAAEVEGKIVLINTEINALEESEEYSAVTLYRAAEMELDGSTQFYGNPISDVLMVSADDEYPRITLTEYTPYSLTILVIEENFGEYCLDWNQEIVRVKGGVELDISLVLDNFNIRSRNGEFEFNDLYSLRAENNTILAEYKRFNISILNKKDGDIHSEQIIIINDKVDDTIIEKPFRLGYEFIKWLNDETDEEYDFDQNVVKDLTLYAEWENYFATEDPLGTEESPIMIATYGHLLNFAYVFSSGFEYYENYKDKYYQLSNNIEVSPSDEDYIIAGSQENVFEGTLDGNGYIIKDIRIREKAIGGWRFAALIFSNEGTIKNLGISGDVYSQRYASAFVSENYGTIENCFNLANVTSDWLAAGIAVDNLSGFFRDGVIRNCYNAGNIEAENETEGIVLNTYGNVLENCYNIGVADGLAKGEDQRRNNYTNIQFAVSDRPEENMSTLQMLGEDTEYHTNELFAALNYEENEGVWTIIPNEDNKWYYPQLKVFEENPLLKELIAYEIIYVVTYEYDDGITPNSYEFIFDGDLVQDPVDPEKELKLFDGWYVVENGEASYLFDFDTLLTDDVVLRATWVTYRYIFDELSIIGIEIAEGVEELTITIPKDVSAIKSLAFSGKSNIAAIEFEGDSMVSEIADRVFLGTAITTITLPASVQKVDAKTFFGADIESVLVDEESLYFASLDGDLYTKDMSELVYYPAAKAESEYEMPDSVRKIWDYAFVGYEAEGNYFGNLNLEKIVLSLILQEVGEKGLYGLANLKTVTIKSPEPVFDAPDFLFRYWDADDVLNPELIIELNNYTAFLNFMENAYWAEFEEYYSYPVVITFVYNEATANCEEATRTRVGGLEDGELIKNGMTMGELPFPHKFGFDFVEWNTQNDGNGDIVDEETVITTDLTIYAIWQAWDYITLTDNDIGDIFVNGINHNKTISEILAVDTVFYAYFDDIYTDEQIQISDRGFITLTGSLTSGYDKAAILIGASVTIRLDLQVFNEEKGIAEISEGDDSRVEFNYDENTYIIQQSPTSKVTLYSDRAEASLPDPDEYNILTWHQTENIGRNQTTLSFSQMTPEEVYCPIAKLTLTITDTTVDYVYNASTQGVTYSTNRDNGIEVICDVAYFLTEEDMLAGENEIPMPSEVGTYFYVISRKGYDDYCDADDVTGSYEITKKTVIISGLVTLSKVYDGNDLYTELLIQDEHYIVDGIVDDAFVTTHSVTFNSAEVAFAEYVTVEITISDTHNYSMASTFIIDAEILPCEVTVIWTGDQAEYIYNALDQSPSITAVFKDIYNNDIALPIEYSGQSDVFMTAGSYNLTAINDDTNYEILDYQRTVIIHKKQVIVSALDGVILEKVFDGTNIYPYELAEGEHYSVEGIVDDAQVILGDKIYNSPDVDFATSVTVRISITDTDNYTIEESFEFEALISPKPVQTVWNEEEWDFVYTAGDLSDGVKAVFYDVNDNPIDLTISFIGESTVFMIAGDYTATASTMDTNYQLLDYTKELTIQKAMVLVSTVAGASISRIYDGNKNYEGDFELGVHYEVQGIVDDATVQITNIQFNSAEVDEAYQATYQPVISDTHNYYLTGDFVIDAVISPLGVDVVWIVEERYVYNYYDQSDKVDAYFINIYGQEVDLIEEYGLGEFRTAGLHTVTAVNSDTNYSLNNPIRVLEIEKAQVTVTAILPITKVFDGNDLYHDALVEGEHYQVDGIAEGDLETSVSVVLIRFNSIHVSEAEEATAYVEISDMVNYDIPESFKLTASITPKPVNTIWNEEEWDFVYTANDLSDGVKAVFYDVDDNPIDLTISFSGESTVFMTAGVYTLTASTTDSDYQLLGYTREVTIQKAAVTAQGLVTLEKVYDGLTAYFEEIVEGADFEVIGIVDDATVSIGDIAFNSEDVAFASYATVEITISDNDNYDLAFTFIMDAKVLPCEVNVLWTGDQAEYIYNALDQSPSITAVFKDIYNNDIALTIEYSGQSDVFMTTGVYTLTASTTDTNYQLLDDQRTIIMKKKEVKVEGMITLSKEYDSTDIYPYELIEGIHYFVDGIVDDAQVILGDKIYNSPDVDFATSVTVWISITDTDNYTIEESFEFEALISPKPTQVFWSHQDEYTYNGEDFGDTVSAYYLNVAGEEVLPIIAFSGESTVFMTAGYYTVTATTEDTNYQLTQAQIELYIDKAQAVITAQEEQTHTYDRTVKNIIAHLNHDETTLEYTPSQGYEDVGEYAITIIAEETDNYYRDTLDVMLIIQKAEIDMLSVDFEDKSWVYDGEEKSLEVTGDIPFEINDIIYHNNSLTDVGQITVTAEFVYDYHNYHTVEDMHATITITQRPLIISIHNKQSVYGEELEELTCEVENLVEGDDLGLSLFKEEGLIVGEYTIWGEITNPNYAPEFINGVYTIVKATHDMSNILFEDKQVTYNAVEHTLVISGTLPQGVNVEYTDNKGINVGEYQAKATFVYDEHNYHAIEDMTATLTIVRRDITVSFSDYEDLIYDGSVKSVGVVLNNIPDEEEDLSPIITYNKEVLNPGRYTVTVTINNDNYNLVGKNSLDFILYLDKLENQDQVGNKDVIAFADKGFLPEADIDVVNLHQRKPLTVGKFAGKEIRQNVFIRIIDDESRNEYMTMRILIHPDFRYLENLWVGMLQEDGSIVEIESHREGDYLVFKAYDQDATYVVIGDGKGEAVWTVPVVASSAGILILSIVGIGIRSKRRKRLKQRIIGQ